MPYYIRTSFGLEVVFDSETEGAIAPDGNELWLIYQAWLAEGNEPEIRENP